MFWPKPGIARGPGPFEAPGANAFARKFNPLRNDGFLLHG